MGLHELLMDTFYFLIATLALVPLFKLLKLGSMLGYIVAGILIGPMCLGLIDNSNSIVQLAELGIALLLFIVGLELTPARIKQLRKNIILVGGLQMLLTTFVFSIIGIAFGLSYTSSFVMGIALSLSSTAFALSYMTENSQLTPSHGQTSLSILLFQDLLIVPLLALLPLLGNDSSSHQPIIMSVFLFKLGVFSSIIFLCFHFLNPVITFIKKTQDPEISLAAFLFLVIGMAIGMEKIGLSMPMGSFIAGVFLANSEIKKEVKTLTLPFKGILMGLFFMTLGVNLELQFIVENLGKVSLICLIVLTTKSGILIILGRFINGNFRSGLKVSLLVSQAGEFGLVVLGSAIQLNIISSEINKLFATSILMTMISAPFIAHMTKYVKVAHKINEDEDEDEDDDVEIIDSSNVIPIQSIAVSDKKSA